MAMIVVRKRGRRRFRMRVCMVVGATHAAPRVQILDRRDLLLRPVRLPPPLVVLGWRALLLGGGPAECKVVEDDLELGLGEAYLVLEVAYDPVAPADRVGGAGVGLEDDGAHGVVLLGLVEAGDDLDDVADAEEAVGVEELGLAVMGEVGGEDAVGGALAALVLAGGAGLGGGAVAARLGRGGSGVGRSRREGLVVVVFEWSFGGVQNVVGGLHGLLYEWG